MDQQQTSEILAACDRRRNERRSFLRAAGGASVAFAGAGLLAACDDTKDIIPAPTPTPTASPTTAALTDADVLNFALNLEYLEAQFYSFAAFGVGLATNLTTGTGAAGAVTGGQRANISGVVAAYAREIARDEIAHVAFLRQQLGTSAVAQPALDIGVTATSAFSNAARAAGLVGAGVAFNPYENEQNFLLGAYIFEDVGVTAYKGAISLISNKTFVEAAAGIHAAEAYHAGLIRTLLYQRGLATGAANNPIWAASEAISNARDSLDGTADLDQGVTGTGFGTAAVKSNIVPTDNSGIVFSRSAGQVLNIVYLNNTATTSGGFFPSGVNGTIRTSAAS